MFRWLQSVEDLKNMGDISCRTENSEGEFCMMLRFTKDCNGSGGEEGGGVKGGEGGIGRGGGERGE